LAEWQEHIGQLCIGNTRLVFAVSCAFAAPLLYLTDSESGGFHFRGDSSVGKTTAGWAGGSVWGGGGIRGYIKGWRTTINGLENVATVHSDALLVLDEIGQAESKAVAQAAYLLANGQGASRMRRDTSSRPVATWQTLYLGSGEISLAAKVEEDGQRKASPGQEIRILDIPARASDKLGLFEDLHGAPSGQEFADNIRKAAGTYYEPRSGSISPGSPRASTTRRKRSRAPKPISLPNTFPKTPADRLHGPLTDSPWWPQPASWRPHTALCRGKQGKLSAVRLHASRPGSSSGRPELEPPK
jgi:hypothetical protein